MIRADRADGDLPEELHGRSTRTSTTSTSWRRTASASTRSSSKYSREYGILSFTSRPRHLRELRRVLQRRLRRLPGLRAERAPRPARRARPRATGSSSATATPTTTRSGCRARPATAPGRTTTASTTTRPGVTTDSFAGGHPGMPQDNSKWSHNLIYSNNNNLFNDERDAYCRDTPWEERDPQKVCPTFQVPVGTGHLIAGGNANIVEENYIFDNWRRGTMLHWVPAALRGEEDSAQDVRHVGEQPVPAQLHEHPAASTSTTSTSRSARGRRTRTASTSGGTRRRATTASRSSPAASTTTLSSATAGPATSGFDGQAYTSDPPALLLPACPGLDFVPAGQLGEAGDARAVRDVAPDRQPGPARLRLVHHAARAAVRAGRTAQPMPDQPISVGAWTPHALLSRRCSCSPSAAAASGRLWRRLRVRAGAARVARHADA